ncbi:Hypothetical Protein FCC1311_112632, partial [Hondaea fermentalgiana]
TITVRAFATAVQSFAAEHATVVTLDAIHRRSECCEKGDALLLAHAEPDNPSRIEDIYASPISPSPDETLRHWPCFAVGSDKAPALGVLLAHGLLAFCVEFGMPGVCHPLTALAAWATRAEAWGIPARALLANDAIRESALHQHTDEEGEAPRRSLCSGFMQYLFPDPAGDVQGELERIDATLRRLHAEAAKNEAAKRTLRDSLRRLRDPKTRFNDESMTRDAATTSYNLRLVGHLRASNVLVQQIKFFERTRATLLNSQLAEQMAANISDLRARAGTLRIANPEQLAQELSEIEDVNADMRELNDHMADAMQVSSFAGVDSHEDARLLAEFMAEIEEEGETEDVAQETPRAQHRAAAPKNARVPETRGTARQEPAGEEPVGMHMY